MQHLWQGIVWITELKLPYKGKAWWMGLLINEYGNLQDENKREPLNCWWNHWTIEFQSLLKRRPAVKFQLNLACPKKGSREGRHFSTVSIVGHFWQSATVGIRNLRLSENKGEGVEDREFINNRQDARCSSKFSKEVRSKGIAERKISRIGLSGVSSLKGTLSFISQDAAMVKGRESPPVS